MDLFTRNLSPQRQVWSQAHWVSCVDLPGIICILRNCWYIGSFKRPLNSDTNFQIVTCFQAAVLLLFNTTDKLSYNDILTQLNLSHEDLVRLLHSLSCARYKILVKEPSTKIVSQTDSFEFNAKFTDRMRRIKVCKTLTHKTSCVTTTGYYLRL